MDVNKPITNPDLIAAIQAMRRDESKKSAFFTQLHKATFLCPARIDITNANKGEGGKVTLGEGSSISLLSLASSSGEAYLMAFTDWGELGKWKRDNAQQTLMFSFEDYKKIVLGKRSRYHGVVINPYGDNILFTREMLAGEQPQQKSAKGDSVMIGIPQDYPTEMVEKLADYFSRTKRVNAAYLLWMVRNGEAGYLLVLGTRQSPQELFPAVEKLCKPYLNGKLLDMITLNTSFGKSAVEGQKPFYRV